MEMEEGRELHKRGWGVMGRQFSSCYIATVCMCVWGVLCVRQITDKAAHAFSQAFYAELVTGATVSEVGPPVCTPLRPVTCLRLGFWPATSSVHPTRMHPLVRVYVRTCV